MHEATRHEDLVRHPALRLRPGWTSLPLWAAAWLLAGAATLLGVLVLDHPLALVLHARIGPSRLAYLLVRWPEALAGLTIAGAAGLGLWRCLAGPLRGGWNTLFLACLGVCVALAVKSELKLLFGRVAPDRWFDHQSMPLRNFHMLYAGSFPSGHMAVLGVLAAFVWAYGWPVRLAWVLASAAVGGALMVVGAHFLTDLVTGALLGVSIGAACRRVAAGQEHFQVRWNHLTTRKMRQNNRPDGLK